MLLSFIRTKDLTYQVGILDSYIKEITLPCCTIMSNGSFIQMTAIIKFMTINLFPTTLSPPTGKAIAFISNTSGKIAIRFLSSSNQGNNAIQISIQRFIIFHSQRIRGSFYNLIRISIIKRKVTAMFSLHQTTSYGEVIKASILLTFLKC